MIAVKVKLTPSTVYIQQTIFKTMKVPWRSVSSWYCSACGECCKGYKVRLSFYEYLKLKHTGFVEEKVGRYYIRKINNTCPFQIGNLCSLQGETKPLACKLYPFVVLKRGNDKALYEYNNEEFYVYVELGCPNLKLGKSNKKIEVLVREAIQLFLGKKDTNLITCYRASITPHQSPLSTYLKRARKSIL